MNQYIECTAAADVTEEIMDIAAGVLDGWYSTGTESKIDWEDFIDRMDGTWLAGDTFLDMGNDMQSSAIRYIKKRISEMRAD